MSEANHCVNGVGSSEPSSRGTRSEGSMSTSHRLISRDRMSSYTWGGTSEDGGMRGGSDAIESSVSMSG